MRPARSGDSEIEKIVWYGMSPHSPPRCCSVRSGLMTSHVSPRFARHQEVLHAVIETWLLCGEMMVGASHSPRNLGSSG